MHRRGLITDRQQFIALEFQQFPAACAIQMVVLGIAVIVVIHGSAIELKAVQQACINAFSQGSVDRCGADVVFFSAARQSLNQFFRIEVIVLAEHLVDQKFSLAGLTQPARLQVFTESLLGR